jgi:hypothetical protein
MRIFIVTILLILLGCANQGAQVAQRAQKVPCEKLVTVVEPPPKRYQIKYQNRGVNVVPNFAAVDRDSEYVVVPAP